MEAVEGPVVAALWPRRLSRIPGLFPVPANGRVQCAAGFSQMAGVTFLPVMLWAPIQRTQLSTAPGRFASPFGNGAAAARGADSFPRQRAKSD